MPGSVKILHLTVISPFVRDVKGGSDWAAVRVESASIEQVAVQVLVQIVDGIVKSQQYQLRDIFDPQAA